MPAKLAKRICLYGLMPQTLWVVEESWKPDSVREGELELTVEEVSPQDSPHARPRLGAAVGPGVLRTWPDHKFIKNLENRYDARLEGVIVYDRAKKKIVRWDMAALGDYTGRWFAGNNGWKEATPRRRCRWASPSSWTRPRTNSRRNAAGRARSCTPTCSGTGSSSTGTPTSGWRTGRNGNRSNASKLANCMAQQY